MPKGLTDQFELVERFDGPQTHVLSRSAGARGL